MMISRSNIVICFFFISQSIVGQDILALRMVFDHDPSQWELIAEQEEGDGRLETFDYIDARKLFWNYNLYGSSGRIWNLFPGQYDNWRLQGDTVSVSIQSVFQGRWPEWRISDGHITLTLRAAKLSNPFHWIIEHPEYGHWEMYAYYEFDPRDWEIQDELTDSIPLEMKVAASFIVIAVNFMLL